MAGNKGSSKKSNNSYQEEISIDNISTEDLENTQVKDIKLSRMVRGVGAIKSFLKQKNNAINR